MGQVSGVAVAALGVGLVFLWSGIKGASFLSSFQQIIQGKKPTWNQTNPISIASSGASTGSTGATPAAPAASGSLQSYAKTLLAQHGWQNQWASFNSLEMSEAGWNPHAKNPSGAYGLAQALAKNCSSATNGTESSQYCGEGLSTAQAIKANSGDGYSQLVWMCNYVASRYGSPDKAWSFHQANNWY